MQLALSSAAAPDLPLPDLLRASKMRGLAGLELVLESVFGERTESVETAAERITRAEEDSGARVLSLITLSGERAPDRALRLARALGLPVVLRPSAFDRVPRDVMRRHAGEGGRVLLLHLPGEHSLLDLERRTSAHLEGVVGVALDIDPAAGDHGPIVQTAIDAAGPDLAYIRLRGGGPEAAQQTGMGIGSLMARLTLARYTGPLVLTPSTKRYHQVWKSWLGRPGGWGCGSKVSDPSLVVLAAPSNP